MGTEGTYRQVDSVSFQRRQAERRLVRESFEFFYAVPLAYTAMAHAMLRFWMNPTRASVERSADVVPIFPDSLECTSKLKKQK